MLAQKWHFVVTLPTSDSASRARSQRLTRSQAAKSAHSKKRQRDTLDYQRARVNAEQRQGQLLAHAMFGCRSDPFNSFARTLQPIEHLLLDHYATYVATLMRCNDSTSYFSDSMTQQWLPLALTDAGLLASIFLASCRDLARKPYYDAQRYVRLAAKYKLECVQSLRSALAITLPLGDVIVATALSLAYDELATGNVAMSKNHLEGAVKMISLNGGPQALGLDGFLEHMMSRLLQKFECEVTVPANSIVVT